MQTDEEVAEMIAKFRTPPGMNWKPLAEDIQTLLKARAPRCSDCNEPLSGRCSWCDHDVRDCC